MSDENRIDYQRLLDGVDKIVSRRINGTQELLQGLVSRVTVMEVKQDNLNEMKEDISDMKDDINIIKIDQATMKTKLNDVVDLKNVVIRWVVGAFAVLVIGFISVVTYVNSIIGGM